MSYGPPDEQNPYAAPQSKIGPEYAGGGVSPTGGKVRFGAVGEAWSLMQTKMGTWILISLVYLICAGGIGFVLGLGVQFLFGVKPGPNGQAEIDATFFASQFVQMVLSTIVSSFFIGGFFLASLKAVRGQRFGVEDLFGAGSVIGPLVVATLLVTLATWFGLILLIIPGLYISSRLALSLPLVVDRGLSGTEAMKASWHALGGQVGSMFGVLFCAGLLSILGALLCGIGVILTMPVYYLAVAIVYRDLFLAKPTYGAPAGNWPDAI